MQSAKQKGNSECGTILNDRLSIALARSEVEKVDSERATGTRKKAKKPMIDRLKHRVKSCTKGERELRNIHEEGKQ